MRPAIPIFGELYAHACARNVWPGKGEGRGGFWGEVGVRGGEEEGEEEECRPEREREWGRCGVAVRGQEGKGTVALLLN